MAALKLMDQIAEIELHQKSTSEAAARNPRKYFFNLYAVCLKVTKSSSPETILSADRSNPAPSESH